MIKSYLPLLMVLLLGSFPGKETVAAGMLQLANQSSSTVAETPAISLTKRQKRAQRILKRVQKKMENWESRQKAENDAIRLGAVIGLIGLILGLIGLIL